MSAPVVFAVQRGNALRVYVRNGDAELRQVSESTVDVEVDPTRLVTLVADLDSQLGWTGQSSAGGDRVLGLPPAVEAPPKALPKGKTGPKPGTSTRRQQLERSARRRATILAEMAKRSVPVSAADLRPLFSADEWKTGAAHSALARLVDAGQLVRTGVEGAYRWSLPTGTDSP